MSGAPTVEDIVKDARWLIQALDPTGELVRVVDLDRNGYQSASFLDDRMFQSPLTTHVAHWSRIVEAIPANARRDARWIFHIGHVGSTLLARLLGEFAGVLSIREPRILRDVTGMPDEKRVRYTEPLKALLSRTFAESETALVKATSFVSEIAPELLAPSTLCLFMYASPRAYIETILAGDNSREEMRVLAESRAARLSGRVPSLARPVESEAHLAAVAWACEMTSLEAAAQAAPEAQVAWVDFDRMLADVEEQLREAAALLGFTADQDLVRKTANGPLMRRYSKALEYDYSPALRKELLAEAGRFHGRDIDSAIAMLARAAENAPLLASALQRAKPEN
jgi:hypothetical protein